MATFEIGHGVEEDDDEDPDMKVGECAEVCRSSVIQGWLGTKYGFNLRDSFCIGRKWQ